nr:uncharacterized protein LOC127332308 [Lolium perenne]
MRELAGGATDFRSVATVHDTSRFGFDSNCLREALPGSFLWKILGYVVLIYWFGKSTPDILQWLMLDQQQARGGCSKGVCVPDLSLKVCSISNSRCLVLLDLLSTLGSAWSVKGEEMARTRGRSMPR